MMLPTKNQVTGAMLSDLRCLSRDELQSSALNECLLTFDRLGQLHRAGYKAGGPGNSADLEFGAWISPGMRLSMLRSLQIAKWFPEAFLCFVLWHSIFQNERLRIESSSMAIRVA